MKRFAAAALALAVCAGAAAQPTGTDVMSALVADPEGLTIDFGAGFASLDSLIPSLLRSTVSGESSLSGMFCLRAGLSAGRSSITVRVSPYLGGLGDVLLVDARTGYLIAAEDDPKHPLILKASTWFYATMLSWKSASDSSGAAPIGNETGILNTGVGIDVAAGWRFGRSFEVCAGAYASFGAILPTIAILDFGLTADASFRFDPHWSVFVHSTLWKNLLDMSFTELGVSYRF